jgi:hypothetical protein
MESDDPFTADELKQLRENIAKLSPYSVRRLYETAWTECRMKEQRLPPAKSVQQLVQAWRQLWLWNRWNR